ncbi:MAG: DUF3035 domain-containing protein [Magnetovibrionaceae bacterium]
MNKLVMLAVVGTALVALGACEGTKQALVGTTEGPDEFAVYSRAPLSLPPDFNLRPPAPGAERPQADNPRATARQILLRERKEPARRAAPQGATPGVQALLRSTGADLADPTVRQTINQETTNIAQEELTVTERLMFWDNERVAGSIVDAEAEQKRIQENKALGKPLNEGEVPEIRRKPKALLEGLF